MKKLWIILLVCLFLSACRSDEKTEQESEYKGASPTTNTLNVVIGKPGENEQLQVLRATDLSGIVLSNPQESIAEVLSTAQMDDPVLEMIRVLLAPEFLDENSSFYGKEGYYISKETVKAFHANTKDYVLMERIIVFDQEMNPCALLIATYSDAKGYVITQGSLAESYWEEILTNSESKYILITNGGKVSALTPDNELLPSYGTQVEGDYYGALAESMAFSMQELMMESNLLWVVQ